MEASLIGSSFVVGPLFRSLHLQLDELIESWGELAESIAERSVAVGFNPDGQSATVARETTLRGVERAEFGDHVVVRALRTPLGGSDRAIPERLPCSSRTLEDVIHRKELTQPADTTNGRSCQCAARPPLSRPSLKRLTEAATPPTASEPSALWLYRN
jgi:hypothetical protein